MKKISLLIIIGIILTNIACNLEKEIEVELPEYKTQFIVECYLEPGQPFSLLLTESEGYFSSFPSGEEFINDIFVDSAQITITQNGNIYELTNQLFYNPFTKKLFNYSSPEIVPNDLEHDFSLEIITKEGEKLTATTHILPVIPIDSTVFDFNDTDTIARVFTYFTDLPGETNYFRRMTHHNSLDSIPLFDFVFDDRAVEDDGKMLIGTPYDYPVGDTVFSTIYHIDKAYFDFLNSILIATNAAQDPFGQPSVILSNIHSDVVNPLGIFTGLSYDRRMVIIEK